MIKIADQKNGYTLVELLITVMVLVIILSAVAVIINPLKRKAQVEDYRRENNINAIMVAVKSYIFESYGQMIKCGDTEELPRDNEWYCIGTGLCMDTSITATECDLNPTLVTDYLEELPKDPTKNSDTDTGYAIKRDLSNKISIKAFNKSKYYPKDELILESF